MAQASLFDLLNVPTPPPPPPVAVVARDRALARVRVRASGFMERALPVVASLPVGASFTGEAIRHEVTKRGIVPEHHNAWGALLMTAVRRGYLQHSGRYEQMKDKQSHARMTPVYVVSEGLTYPVLDGILDAVEVGMEVTRDPDPKYRLYYAAVDADKAWHDELVKVYGKDAGDARYCTRGVATPRLRELKDAYLKAADAHIASMRASRVS